MSQLNLQEKYDLLLHIVQESDLSEEDKLKGVKELFPRFDSSAKNDKLLTDYIIETYAHSRSLGLSTKDSAHNAGISTTLLNKSLYGENLSLERFMTLITSELYAQALMKKAQLSNIETKAKGDYRAAIAFLEKIYPEQYGAKVQIEDTSKNEPKYTAIEIARRIAFLLRKAVHDKKPTTIETINKLI